MVFILIALDKIHHSHGPWSLCEELPKEVHAPIAVAIEIDVERSINGVGPTYAMRTLRRSDEGSSPVDRKKLRAPESNETLSSNVPAKDDDV